jgi:hypothetical protein
MSVLPKNPRKLGKLLHMLYLEVVKDLSPGSYNPNAVKAWKDLTPDQRKIDIGIAERLLELICDVHDCKNCGKHRNGRCVLVFPEKCRHYKNTQCKFVKKES